MTTSLAFRKVLTPVLILLSLVLLIGVGVSYLQQKLGDGNLKAINSLKIGSELADIELTKLDHEKVRLSQIQGRVFLMNFWATWCEACMEEMPSLVKLRQAYHDQGFEVLAVNLDESPESVVPKAVKKWDLPFPVFMDPEGKTAEIFDIHGIPFTVIFDQDRKILMMKNGDENWNAPKIHTLVEGWLKR